MNLTKQVEGFVNYNDVKVMVHRDQLYAPVSVEHVNLDNYHGDARSFGYNQDEGKVSVIKYEIVLGIIGDSYINLLKDIKQNQKQIKQHKLDIDELEYNDLSLSIDLSQAELLDTYKSPFEILYKLYLLNEKFYLKINDNIYLVDREEGQQWRSVRKQYNQLAKVINKQVLELREYGELAKQA